ncbi:maltotransferase domain-containing protein [Actinomyces minihominis]|uniref:maltotransferase domain-containing protein n=1 Tax=Actinomyces minihominis TaxID=2002838 RepID=UPI000C082787|nr:maltotransferase domain-containing protein [Actinomyces minihominis]
MNTNNARLLSRIPAIEVFPVLAEATLPAKATEGEAFPVRATVFREGHDQFGAEVVLITPDRREFSRTRMYAIAPGMDRMEAWVMADTTGDWSYRIDTWSDPWATWKHDAAIKIRAGVDSDLMCEEGARILERAALGDFKRAQRAPSVPAYRKVKPDAAAAKQMLLGAETLRDTSISATTRFAAAVSSRVDAAMSRYPLRDLIECTVKYPVRVDRKAALYGSWYEVFPRSFGAFQRPDGTWKSGTLAALTEEVKHIAEMGFTVLYLTPIHPIGTTFRKGRNNTLEALDGDPGSPYGIGSTEGGHDALHPELGDFDDFDSLVEESHRQGMEVALDLALQASPDHPWVKEHPEWFTTRADGSIAYAENPPKKYQDIYPLNFDNDPEGIYRAIIDVVEVWISHGVRIFRVDNPHTKPIPFWQRFLRYMHINHPGVIFLAEAFTRPAMMRTLGMVGFQQSYTYFTWRQSKKELTDYFNEVAKETAHVSRPTFWPTTHDILTHQMTTGGASIFAIRAILAATGSPTWGIYSGYELVENVQRPGFEEQIDNEKYEYRPRSWDAIKEGGIANLLTQLNRARANHPALQQLHQISFHHTSNDNVICFSKHVPARFSPTGEDDTVIVVVSLDPHSEVESTVYLNKAALFEPETRTRLGVAEGHVDHGEPMDLELVDELGGQVYHWGRENYVQLSPWTRTGHVFSVRSVSTPQ